MTMWKTDMELLSALGFYLTLNVLIRTLEARCIIPPYIRDTWLFDSKPETQIRLRESVVIYESPGVQRKRYECIERDNMIMLLHLRKSQTPESVKHGYVCILMSSMEDIGLYTIRRLNGFDDDVDSVQHLMEPQFVDDTDKNITISNFCKGNTDMDMVFVKRKAPGCRFPGKMIGKWKTNFPGMSSVDVAADTLTLLTSPPTNLSVTFWCYSKDYGRFLLRFANGTRETGDAFMCAKIAYLRRSQRYRLLVQQHGTLFHGLMKVTHYLQPVHLYVDCKWNTYPISKYFLYNHQGS